MLSKLSLFANIFLVSVVLAAPSSRLEARLARHRENRQSQPLNRALSPTDNASNVQYNANWAGAVWNKGNARTIPGTFASVTGTFIVPTTSGAIGSGASAWVGIDGDSCQNAILQTGVDFTVGNDGVPMYNAWYEWYPDGALDFSGITINAGDVIRATVAASSTTSGKAVVEDLTTGKTVIQDLSSSHALCGQNAEWIVEDFQQGGGLVSFADFGNVTFTSASASGPHGKYAPSGATIVDIQQDNKVLTSSSVSGSSVFISYQ